MSEQQQPQDNRQQSQKFEKQMIGRYIAVRSLDWQRELRGELVKVERYIILLKLDSSGTVGIYKHSIASFAPVKRPDATGGAESAENTE